MTITGPGASVERHALPGGAMWRAGVVGGLGGLAWAGALRAVMAEVARPSHVAWSGTFVGILVPGAAAGALLAIARERRIAGHTGGIRWFALAPLTFVVGVLVQPGFFATVLTQGLGLGGVAFAVLTMAGGFALGARRPRWARMVCGAVAIGFVIAMLVSPPLLGGPRVALTEPRGAWLACLAVSLTLLGMLAASIPYSGTGRR